MATISLRNVRKKYGGFLAVPDLSLEVQHGEFVILVGPSGCGKSTLLRMLAGLESVTGGEIAIDGEVVNDRMPRQRDIAMVFQSYALYPHMTVAQNMGFSLKLDGRSKAEIAERVQEAAEILALDKLLDRKPAQLSGGQRQRVAMGRSIVRDPKVFLFDEPLSNLDAKLRVQMRAEIKSLHNRLKTTIVYVTHDQVEAMTMADRIVVMNAGQIEQVGTPLELYDRPRSRFVAEFLGSPAMNMLPGTLGGEGGATALRMEDGTTVPIPGVGIEAPAGREVVMGVRPENLSLARGGEGVEAVIDVVEPTGSHTLLIGRIGPHAVTCEIAGRVPVASGSRVRLAADPAALHFFDGESGARIEVRPLVAAE
ncbi:putative sugar uptake ABC transporter ATP-binding protein [Oceanicola granulosus HTCC2516]|uniref:Putative sugar uptake ABC transporter ATP-binding protein n=1 Tax=Oceanicola granulosus (strain ATCC BAA-861 / DSM 15982 / KCTC 12143 / HTCC2516) TaxID=314256 RepID=Q2CF13_OCEGH|nr:sn-glycerol-3-phosphate ABC transporter ATP-binding protein UgpC [Oceanicola granulosus]EAR51314.1 putative sugar uptake ABC transporter ATP-binding protein [Oceanicola granulosus HTCC2516]